MREASSRYHRDGLVDAVRTLRTHWRTASLAAGWPFPSDWALPEVDRVCVAASLEEDLEAPLAGLGRARAAAGAGLTETLADLAALQAVLGDAGSGEGFVGVDPDAVPAPLLRAASLAWADVAVAQATSAEITDGLTGLATPAYLRTRLREVYAECRAAGTAPDLGYVLVVVSVDVSGSASWNRLAAVVLTADVLRSQFDAGETLAALGPSVVVALGRRDERLALRVGTVRSLARDRFAVDAQLLRHCTPRVWLERLPVHHEGACALLNQLRRT